MKKKVKNEPIFRRVTLHFAKHSKVEEHGENFAYFLSDHFVKGKVVRPLICEERESAHIINLLLLVEMDNNVKAAGLRSSTKASYTWMTSEVMFRRDFGLLIFTFLSTSESCGFFCLGWQRCGFFSSFRRHLSRFIFRRRRRYAQIARLLVSLLFSTIFTLQD